jgi:hypothetical protein
MGLPSSSKEPIISGTVFGVRAGWFSVEVTCPDAGNEVGDPGKIASLIVALSERHDLPAHLLLGSDALYVFGEAEKIRSEDYRKWLAVSESTVFGTAEGAELRSLP